MFYVSFVTCLVVLTTVAAQGDPCTPYPCGPNTRCTVGPFGIESGLPTAICRCQPGFQPNPDTITGCSAQCTQDSDCDTSKRCFESKCINPCDSGVCADNSVCTVVARRALCSCLKGYTGNPFTKCVKSESGEEPELNHAATGFFQDVLNQIG